MTARVNEVGDWVRIKGQQGTYKVKGFAKDGSVTLYGGNWGKSSTHVSYRNAMPDKLVATKAPTREESV